MISSATSLSTLPSFALLLSSKRSLLNPHLFLKGFAQGEVEEKNSEHSNCPRNALSVVSFHLGGSGETSGPWTELGQQVPGRCTSREGRVQQITRVKNGNPGTLFSPLSPNSNKHVKSAIRTDSGFSVISLLGGHSVVFFLQPNFI